MFGFGHYWGGIFFNKKTTRSAKKSFYNLRSNNLRSNFAIFGGPDGYFDVAPLWDLYEAEFTLI